MYCHWEYFDFTGLAYYGGMLYPAWSDNSYNTDAHMDIFIARVRY